MRKHRLKSVLDARAVLF